MAGWEGIPEFGKYDSVEYRERPGSYGIVFDEFDEVAVIETVEGWYLPGGGIDPGEDEETALEREFVEETGWTIRKREVIGRAIEYVVAEGEGNFAKLCTFFLATLGDGDTEETHEDHRVKWIPYDAAFREMKFASQRWAVARAMEVRRCKG